MNLSAEQIEIFLRKVDSSFPVPLSQKQDLHEFSEKLAEKATLCTVMDGNRVLAMTAGYTENVVDRLGYMSILSTLPEARGRGYAQKTVQEFLGKAEERGCRAVHLYTVHSNRIAVDMYKKLGFVEWKLENELRPDDLHLICYLKGGEI